jgi:ATP-binding cassette, subfamily B, bacterial
MHWSRYQMTQVLREEWRPLGWLFLILLLQALISILEPWPLQIIFDNVILEQPVAGSLVRALGPVREHVSRHLLGVMVSVLMIIALVDAVALYAQNFAVSRLNQRVVNKIRIRLFSHILDLSVAYFNRVGSGEIVSRITSDTADIQALVEGGTVLAFRSFPTILGISVVMLWIDYRFAILGLAVTPFLAWSTLFFGKKVKQASRQQRSHETEVATVAEVAARTQKCLKILGIKEQEVQRLSFACACSEEAGVEAGVEAGAWQGGYTAVTHSILSIGTALVVLMGVWRIQTGHISPGEMLVFMSYLGSLYKPIREFTKFFNKMSKAMACSERIEDVMAITPCRLGVCDRPEAVTMPPFRESIVFDHVSFGYQPNAFILHDVDLEVKKGQKVAIVGDSGGGKSTLLSLIPRFFDPAKARILIDEVDLRAYSLDSLRAAMAIVPQDVITFGTTVMANIAIGKPGEQPAEADVVRAAKLANAHEFIEALPDGYQTVLGASGIQLSGGQAKRIHIARALLRDAPILLLDEPTSGLNPSSEVQVMEAFDRLMEYRTIFMVSHHLPIVANADQIIVVRQGRIVEHGTHHEFMRQSTVYRQFWNEQMRKVVPSNADR